MGNQDSVKALKVGMPFGKPLPEKVHNGEVWKEFCGIAGRDCSHRG